MANSRILSVVAVLFLLVLLPVGFLTEVSGGEMKIATNTIDCPTGCAQRCSKASRRKMCVRACNTCCRRCHCVPPGTSGNEDVCPCYANMKTHGGRPKCP